MLKPPSRPGHFRFPACRTMTRPTAFTSQDVPYIIFLCHHRAAEGEAMRPASDSPAAEPQQDPGAEHIEGAAAAAGQRGASGIPDDGSQARAADPMQGVEPGTGHVGGSERDCAGMPEDNGHMADLRDAPKRRRL